MTKTRKLQVYISILTFIAFNLLTSQSFSNESFSTFVVKISKEAKLKGISKRVIENFKNKVSFIPRVVELDRSQPEFKLSLNQYYGQ